MIDDVGVHRDAAIGDGGCDDSVLHDRGLGSCRACMLADRLAAGCPCRLPFRHLARIGHEGGDGIEVLADLRAVAEGVRIAHEVRRADLGADLAEGNVRRHRQSALQRDRAVIVVVEVRDRRAADIDRGLSIDHVGERIGARIERSRECHDLEG